MMYDYKLHLVIRPHGLACGSSQTDEAIHLFLAEDLYKTHQHLDDGEMLNYYFLPLDEVLKKVRRGEINDGKTLAALLHYVLLKKNN